MQYHCSKNQVFVNTISVSDKVLYNKFYINLILPLLKF